VLMLKRCLLLFKCLNNGYSWVAYPVLSKVHSHDAELIEAFAAPIVNKKDTSRLIKELATVYPLPELTHIKRDKQVTVALKGQLFTSSMKAKMQDYMAAARAGQERGVHPLNHTVMVCIDLVARGQRGGAYTHDKYPSCQFVLPDSSPSEIGEVSHLHREQPECNLRALYFLCHAASPVQEVFYGTASTDVAFGTKYKINAQKYQTHRFEVFKGVLSQQYQN
uniref:Uncharacterized protein n=1 Tax=Oncorhynchus mykiss TaxID=8022 RepID=A0A8C7PX31_ONCMY